jgi:hypothetical protein
MGSTASEWEVASRKQLLPGSKPEFVQEGLLFGVQVGLETPGMTLPAGSWRMCVINSYPA